MLVKLLGCPFTGLPVFDVNGDGLWYLPVFYGGLHVVRNNRRCQILVLLVSSLLGLCLLHHLPDALEFARH